MEMDFMLKLPDSLLRSVHNLHLLEAMEIALQTRNSKDLGRLIHAREAVKPLRVAEYVRLLGWSIRYDNKVVSDYILNKLQEPERNRSLTLADYDRLLGWSVQYRNNEVYNYVLKNMPRIDPRTTSLVELAKTPALFRMYAPKVLRKIEPTMDMKFRSTGTTLGRVDELLRSHNPEAVLFVVQKYDLEKTWSRVPMNGRTLLMAVCEGGNMEAAKFLIEKRGAVIYAYTDYAELRITIMGRARPKEGKFRAIHFAAMGDNRQLIEYLVSKGANVDERSVLGTTPLMIAAENECLEAAKALLALGADVNAKMSSNLTGKDLAEQGGIESLRTAYRRAKKTGNREMIELLWENGALP
jgi:hypothetical protein